jgi:hypothetical protein
MSQDVRPSTSPTRGSASPPPPGISATDQRSSSLTASPSPITPPSNPGSATASAQSTVTQPKQPRDLWKEAFIALSKDQQDVLQDDADESTLYSIKTVNSVIELTKKEYKEYCARGWHTKQGHTTPETSVRIQARTILCSALQYKDVVEQGLKFDPTGYGTIVWTVVSGGLQLLQNNADRTDAVFESAGIMSQMLSKYAIVEAQYRDWQLQEQAAFEDRLVAMYIALLQYATDAKLELDKSLAGTQMTPSMLILR